MSSIDDLIAEAAGIAKALALRYSITTDLVPPGLVSYEDLYQEAMLGICLAARRYDASRGVKWTTYAWKCASGRIKNYLRDKFNTVKVPRSMQPVKNGVAYPLPFDRLQVVQELAEPLDESLRPAYEFLCNLSDREFAILEAYVQKRPLSRVKQNIAQNILRRLHEANRSSIHQANQTQ